MLLFETDVDDQPINTFKGWSCPLTQQTIAQLSTAAAACSQSAMSSLPGELRL